MSAWHLVFQVAAALLLVSAAAATQVRLGVALDDSNRVQASLRHPGPLEVGSILLYRSTSRLDREIDTIASPVTVLLFPSSDPDAVLVDSMLAHNVTYYYRARVRRKLRADVWTSVDSVRVPDRNIGWMTGSSILVDKQHYFLEVRDGGRMKKRYPIALGSRPRLRKLHQDNASTPEGRYEITNEQPVATFYRAYDIDYPNGMDAVRYGFARQRGLIQARSGRIPGKGGEIQIHGGGIGSNWTNGCIALRNQDIDELFEHERVGRGVPVVIVGSELTREDISSIEDYRTGPEVRELQRRLRELGHYSGEPDGIVGTRTRFALGDFQLANGLPITCDFDSRTLALLTSR